MGDITKLPQWAQKLIARQERELSEAKSVIETMKGANEPTELSYQTWVGEYSEMYLPDGRCTFHLGRDKHHRKHHIRINVEQNIEGHKCLRISALSGPIYVEPAASNVVKITSLRPDLLPED